jgi:hypothetical protein
MGARNGAGEEIMARMAAVIASVAEAALGKTGHNAAATRATKFCLTIAFVVAWATVGHALESCAGVYSASLLRPLPKSVIVHLDRHDDSPRSIRLADAFMGGVATAGVVVQGNPTVMLHLEVDISHPPLPRPPGASPFIPDLRGLQGGLVLTRPETDPSRYARPAHPAGAPILSLRTELTDTRTDTVLWAGDFSCALTSSSPVEQLARDLGQVVGGALGRTAERAAF